MPVTTNAVRTVTDQYDLYRIVPEDARGTEIYALSEREAAVFLNGSEEQGSALLLYTLQDGELVYTKTLAEQVSLPFVSEGVLYYLTNYDSEVGYGDWMQYQNGKSTLLFSGAKLLTGPEGGAWYAIETVRDDQGITSSLTLLQGDARTGICDEIASYRFPSADEVLYTDIDGDIWLWDGSENHLIQLDAEAVEIYAKTIPSASGILY